MLALWNLFRSVKLNKIIGNMKKFHVRTLDADAAAAAGQDPVSAVAQQKVHYIT